MVHTFLALFPLLLLLSAPSLIFDFITVILKMDDTLKGFSSGQFSCGKKLSFIGFENIQTLCHLCFLQSLALAVQIGLCRNFDQLCCCDQNSLSTCSPYGEGLLEICGLLSLNLQLLTAFCALVLLPPDSIAIDGLATRISIFRLMGYVAT